MILEDEMKALKISLIPIASAIIILGFAGAAAAFHSGGVAECSGCHSMHNPQDTALGYLLVASDQSSTCLSCHEHAGDTGPSSYHISTAEADMPAGTAPLQRTPGGDFGWLKKTYNFTVRGTAITEDGATHGHNIIAADKGYVVDPVNSTAPGGDFTSSQLACNSCHDPHGKYRRFVDAHVDNTGLPIKGSGSYSGASNEPDATAAVGVYRLLAGSLYQNTTSGTIGFPGVPAAKVPSGYNRSEATTQTRTAYGNATASGHATWGNWCGTCHPAMHSSGNYVHPVDENLSSIATSYNQYVKTGDLTGNSSTSYSSLVPFVKSSASTYADLATLAVNNDTQLGGPTSADQVSCLSCHRAHASGWEYALRWNMEGEFMTYNNQYPGTDTTPTSPQFARGRTSAETQAAYYDRPVTVFANYQRVYCNKCHAKD